MNISPESRMPVIFEDIWMRILRIGDEDAFLADRIHLSQYESICQRESLDCTYTPWGEWSRDRPTPSSRTRLKPLSANFSAVCSQWRKAVLATGTCWVTTINAPLLSPISEYVVQESLHCHRASDMDIYIHTANPITAEQLYAFTDDTFRRMRSLFRMLLGFSSRWRSLMVLNLESSEISTVIDGLNSIEISNRLIALDMVSINLPMTKVQARPKIPKESLIASHFPSLLLIHIQLPRRRSLGPSADFPSVVHMSLRTFETANNLLHSISNASTIKSLLVHEGWIDPSITGPVLGVPHLVLRFLTELDIHLLSQDVLPFFRCMELSSLKTVCIETGFANGDRTPNRDRRSPIMPEAWGGEAFSLPSLTSFRLFGGETSENYMTLISQFSMQALMTLSIQSENHQHLGFSSRWISLLPHVKLPSIHVITLEQPAPMEDSIALFDCPQLRTLVLKAEEFPEEPPPLHDLRTYQIPPTSFPQLKALEIHNYDQQHIEKFIRGHDFPSLVSIKLLGYQLDFDSASWAGFLENNRLLVERLEELEVSLFHAEGGEEMLLSYAPLLHRVGRNSWRRF